MRACPSHLSYSLYHRGQHNCYSSLLCKPYSSLPCIQPNAAHSAQCSANSTMQCKHHNAVQTAPTAQCIQHRCTPLLQSCSCSHTRRQNQALQHHQAAEADSSTIATPLHHPRHSPYHRDQQLISSYAQITMDIKLLEHKQGAVKDELESIRRARGHQKQGYTHTPRDALCCTVLY